MKNVLWSSSRWRHLSCFGWARGRASRQGAAAASAPSAALAGGPGLAAVPAAGGPGTQPRSCPLLELCAGPVPLPRAWTLCCALQEQRVLWWGGEGFLSGDIRTRGCCGHTRSCSSHCALPACGVRALIPEIVQHFWIFISMWYAG